MAPANGRSRATARPQLIGLRYLREFQCIGGACEESCCEVGWRINIDEGHFRRLRKALGEAEFNRLMEPLPPGERNRGRFGLLVLDERGACNQLDADKRCAIHSRLGADMLSDTCALYPRVPSLIGARKELQTVLSCPEAARRALLTEDATELVELPAAMFPAARKDALRVLPDNPDEPYVHRFDDVRGTMYELLSDRAWPIATRLAATLGLATSLSQFFYPGSPSYSETRFDNAIAVATDEVTLEALHAQVMHGRGDERLPAHFVVELLGSRLELAAPPSYLRVALGALLDCADENGRRIEVFGGDTTAASVITVSTEAVLAVHERRRAALPEDLAERLELYFENYAKAYWIREWYFHAPSLLSFAQVLALRVALLRFLVLGHPGTKAAMAAEGEERVRLFDAVAVECVYGFSRAIEHQDQLAENLLATFEREGLVTLRHGLALLRF